MEAHENSVTKSAEIALSCEPQPGERALAGVPYAGYHLSYRGPTQYLQPEDQEPGAKELSCRRNGHNSQTYYHQQQLARSVMDRLSLMERYNRREFKDTKGQQRLLSQIKAKEQIRYTCNGNQILVEWLVSNYGCTRMSFLTLLVEEQHKPDPG